MSFLSLTGTIHGIFLAHIVAGVFALAIMVVPLLSKKGGKLHVKSGWLYIVAMILVCVFALVITPWRIFADANRNLNSQTKAIFLILISFFTLSAIYFGLEVLKNKKREQASRALKHIGPPLFVVFLGIGTMIIGFMTEKKLLIAFPLLALAGAKSQWSYWTKPPQSKMHWWYAHLNGMGTACIATITAFLVTAVPSVWPSDYSQSIFLWIAPGLIGGKLISYYTSKYKKQFGDG